MRYTIREMSPAEYPLLEDFLYEAIYLPEGTAPPPRSILNEESLRVYIREFGSRPGDVCLTAEAGGQAVGAVWARIMDDYGHVDDETPSLAISLYPACRGRGIGTDKAGAYARTAPAGWIQTGLPLRAEGKPCRQSVPADGI